MLRRSYTVTAEIHTKLKQPENERSFAYELEAQWSVLKGYNSHVSDTSSKLKPSLDLISEYHKSSDLCNLFMHCLWPHAGMIVNMKTIPYLWQGKQTDDCGEKKSIVE